MIVSFVGRSGVGKTTLLCGIIAELKRRGHTVAVIKHTRKDFSFRQVDKEGKDTYRFCEAGADFVSLVSEKFSFTERNHPSSLKEIASTFNAEFVLVEGFAKEDVPRIFFAQKDSELKHMNGKIIAIVSDTIPDAIRPHDIKGIVSLILEHEGRVT